MKFRQVLAILAAGAMLLGLAPAAAAAHPGHDPEFRALLFTKVAAGAFRHDSIPAAIDMITALATDHHFDLVHSEDAAIFNDADLATFDVVIMAQNGGMVWDRDAQRQAVQTYVNNGGGIAAIHNATDMNIESQFPWWDNLINGGAHMTAHSAGGLTATTHRIDNVHASTKDVPERWQRPEEWYNFKPTMRGQVHSLLEVDEDTYDPGPEAMGTDHPISWCRDAEGGRVWATAMGHAISSYSEPDFIKHVLGGIQTAAGAIPADCSATVDSAFDKVTLDDNTKAPTTLDIAPDGRVFYTEILGQILMWDPETGGVSTALDLPVYAGGEDGLTSLALSPDFANNGHMFVYYSPPGTEEINRVSRFTVAGDRVAPDSEVVLLSIPASRREEPGHTGGYVEFGPNGNLYVGVGDDVNPFQSSGYAPIDERPGRDLFDAQKTSANTNDLRGKILRVHPEPDGTYTIPPGNMFAPGTDRTLPEIYAMGFRNPFRFNVGSDGTLYLADYGPDSGSDDPNRGPAGLVEWNVITEPGFYGWPYCVANDIPYNDFNFATNTSGPKFDCANPVNTSPNNTGLTTLPAAKKPTVWYGNGANGNNFKEMGDGGEAPMAGPAYEFDPNLASDTKFPEFYDGKPFFYEWSRNKNFLFNRDAAGGLLSIDPWFVSKTPLAPMDMKFGPDGSLYVVEWGGGFGRDNPDSGVYRIDYTQGDRRPTAKAKATPSSGQAPLSVAFSSEGSSDPEGRDITFAWDFGDGASSTEASPTHVYAANGVYPAQLVVSDPAGKTGIANLTITVGNTAPTVSLDSPVHGGFFDFGDKVAFDATPTDPEDAEIDCSRAVLRASMGHDAHDHLTETINACDGEFTTLNDEGHADANVFYTAESTYTDGGAAGQPALSGRDVAVLQPKHKQAEFYSSSSGVSIQGDAAAEAGKRVGEVSNNDWIAIDPVNLHQIDRVAARVSGISAGGKIELRAGSPTGDLVATIPVPAQDAYVTTDPVEVTDPGGSTKLHAVFKTTQDKQFTVDSFHFIGKGVSVNAAPYVAIHSDPVTGEAPLDVRFTAEVSDPEGDEPFRYAWNFGDGGTSTEASPTHKFTENGTYPVSVTVTDAAGRSKKATSPIVIAAAPMPPIVCEDPNAEVDPSDEFDGDRLDGCRWNAIVRENRPSMRLGDGLLSVDTLPGDINSGNNNDPKNFILQESPGADWTLETRFRAPVVERYQLAGFLIYGDDDDYVKFVTTAFNGPGSTPELHAELVSENDGQFGNGGNRNVLLGSGSESGWWHLRLKKVGNTYAGEVSEDGTTWTSMGAPVTNEIPNEKVGLQAIGPDQTQGPVTVDFDYFRVVGVDTAAPTVTATLNPASPGPGGWWTSAPTVTLAADDGAGSGVASVEYRVDGGEWTAYTAPFPVGGDGQHKVEYRASDRAGNTSDAGSVDVRVDATAPALAVTGLVDGVTYGHSEDRTVGWTATDATSGIATVTSTLDGTPVRQGQQLVLYGLALGEHRLVVRAVDTAGNAMERVVTFTIGTSIPDLQAMLDRFEAEGRVTVTAGFLLEATLDRARRAHTQGRRDRAITALEQFRALANVLVRDTLAKTVLRADAAVVIASLRAV